MSSSVLATGSRINSRVSTKGMSATPSKASGVLKTGAVGHAPEDERAAIKAAPHRVRIKPVALPVEHGGWGLSLEPVVLGLLVAPSSAGLCLALATVGAFLARHPLKLVVADWRRGRSFPRTRVAVVFTALYNAIALAGFTGAIMLGPAQLLLPLAIALPLAVIQLAYDFTSRSRALLPELAGATAMAAVAASLALAGGWGLMPALALWAILAARVLPTILYVRGRLRAARGLGVGCGIIVATHLLACALTLFLFLKGLASVLAFAALTILLARALVGLRSRPAPARRIGITELLYGALLVAAVATGHIIGI